MAQRKPMLDFISEGDWRLADERQRLLAPLAESENGSVGGASERDGFHFRVPTRFL
jgi:hypothetical protein